MSANAISAVSYASKLTPKLRLWVSRLLLDGHTNETVAAKLTPYVDSLDSARKEVDMIYNDPIMTAAFGLRKKRDKLANLVDVLARQQRMSSIAGSVPMEVNLPPERFFAEYYYLNRPVVLRGLMDDWPALGLWNPETFDQRYGQVVVEVSSDRTGDPKFEERFEQHRKEMTMSDLIRLIQTDIGNDVYIVAKNRLLERPEFADLLQEFKYRKGYFTPPQSGNGARIWFGGAGTITPLHHDASNILFAQVYGRKLVRLISPLEIGNVYNDRACFSAVDIDSPDFISFPRFKNILMLEVVVEPGDFLFFPIGWWHAVRSLEISISLSFQNFDVPGGTLVWKHST